MILTFAFTQFVFVSLGILAVKVLLKAGGFQPDVAHMFPPLAVWLSAHALWLFVVPLGWTAVAMFCDRIGSKAATGFVRASGITVCAAIPGLFLYTAWTLF